MLPGMSLSVAERHFDKNMVSRETRRRDERRDLEKYTYGSCLFKLRITEIC